MQVWFPRHRPLTLLTLLTHPPAASAGLRNPVQPSRARARHQSLNAYLLDILAREADTPAMAEVLADIEAARSPTGLTGDDAVAAVRAVRDAREARWG